MSYPEEHDMNEVLAAPHIEKPISWPKDELYCGEIPPDHDRHIIEREVRSGALSSYPKKYTCPGLPPEPMSPAVNSPSRYPDDLSCHTSSARLEQHSNPDPINAWVAPVGVVISGGPQGDDGKFNFGPGTIVEMDPEQRVRFYVGGIEREPMSRAAERIVGEVIPSALQRFLAKNAEYGDTADELGTAGQYADMNRKMGKLKRTLWDRISDEGWSEGTVEILEDLIGHCALTIDMINQQKRIEE